MDTPSWPTLIRALIGRQALTAEQAAWAMNEIMEGNAAPAQIAGFGVALRAKGETAVEMSGLAASMLAHATPIKIDSSVTDLVGSGGDGAHTVNVSTMATIVAASAGVPMVKHGNRAASSASGSADVLETLGVVIDLPASATEVLFAEIGIAFLFAALYHPSLRHAGPVRAQLGVPTAFNYLGPLTNPARPSSLAVGVADPLMGPVLAGVYAARGNTALVFHGGGLGELPTTAPRTVLGAPALAAQAARAGDIVLLTAAAAIAAADGLRAVTAARSADQAATAAATGEALAKTLSEGLSRAAQAVDSGAAAALLARWVDASNRLAMP